MTKENQSDIVIIGNDPNLKLALDRASRVAKKTIPVRLDGKTGTGKELIARRIHIESGRKGAFEAINCGAIPAELLESELFGHERGAFTGAVTAHTGAFERAHGGTLFLDEIGDMPLALQVKLLRAIQEGEILRLGSSTRRQVDVRIIVATNKDLHQLVNEGAFREDLYYRVAVYPITLPPLRERGRDVITIAKDVLRRKCPGKRLAEDAQLFLRRYAWPGNVRELINVLEAGAVDSLDADIRAATLQDIIERLSGKKLDLQVDEKDPRAAIIAAVREHGRITTGEARTLIRASRAKVQRILSAMENEDLLVLHGKGRAAHYTTGGGGTTQPHHTPPPEESLHYLTDRQRKILQLLGKAAPLAFHDLRSQLSSPPADRTLRDDLQCLKRAGLIGSTGRGRGARWFLTEQRN